MNLYPFKKKTQYGLFQPQKKNVLKVLSTFNFRFRYCNFMNTGNYNYNYIIRYA